MSTRTLVLCKPDAVERRLVGEIVGRLERKQLTIVAMELRTLDAETAGRHYDEHREKPFFGDLVSFITRGPLVALVVEGGEGTWQVVRNLMGVTNPKDAAPGTIRGDLALELTENLVHGSDGPESAAREIAIFFPDLSSARTTRACQPACRATTRLACAGSEHRLERVPVPEPWFSSVVGRDMAVDLGTANTLVYVRGRGIVLDEPSIVAMNTKDGRMLAVGVEAKRMLGRTPGHIQAIRPLKDGVIADFDICEKMLRYFIQRVHQRKWAKPRMVICIPSGITGVERRAVQEAAEFAGARKPVLVIEEPMAAAIGAGLPVHEPTGNMIVDIGGGTTEVAVISLGGVVVSESSRIGGDEFDEAIINFVKREYSLALGEATAEQVKVQLASAWPLEEELYAEVRGRDLVTGLPKTIVVSTVEIREAIEEPTAAIVDAVKVTLDKTPPELAADIMEKGIVITGGGAQLIGLDSMIQAETGMPVHRARHPLFSVVLGSGQCLENFDVLKQVLIASPEG